MEFAHGLHGLGWRGGPRVHCGLEDRGRLALARIIDSGGLGQSKRGLGLCQWSTSHGGDGCGADEVQRWEVGMIRLAGVSCGRRAGRRCPLGGEIERGRGLGVARTKGELDRRSGSSRGGLRWPGGDGEGRGLVADSDEAGKGRGRCLLVVLGEAMSEAMRDFIVEEAREGDDGHGAVAKAVRLQLRREGRAWYGTR